MICDPVRKGEFVQVSGAQDVCLSYFPGFSFSANLHQTSDGYWLPDGMGQFYDRIVSSFAASCRDGKHVCFQKRDQPGYATK